MPGRLPLAFALSVALVAGVAFFSHEDEPHAHALAGIHKIRHVVVIMQENRSFDSYFGTYPGADGIPAQRHADRLRARSRAAGSASTRTTTTATATAAARTSTLDAVRDIDGGKMNGFVREARRGLRDRLRRQPRRALCSFGAAHPDVMGYHDAREIPNYWAYARALRAAGPHVRAGRVVEPAGAPVHGVGVVGALPHAREPTSCVNAIAEPAGRRRTSRRTRPAASRSTRGPISRTCCTSTTCRWRYYVVPGAEPDCDDGGDASAAASRRTRSTPGIWNPLP